MLDVSIHVCGRSLRQLKSPLVLSSKIFCWLKSPVAPEELIRIQSRLQWIQIVSCKRGFTSVKQVTVVADCEVQRKRSQPEPQTWKYINGGIVAVDIEMRASVWQAKADNIIKHGIFMGKINYCIGKFIFTWANLLLHWQIYVCMGNFIMHGKSILYGHNLLIKSILYGHNYFAWAVFTGNYCVRNEGLVPKPRTKLAIFMRKISLRLITAYIRARRCITYACT